MPASRSSAAASSLKPLSSGGRTVTMLRQVLVNLCDNSSLALGDRKGRVTLSVADEGCHVAVRVADVLSSSESPKTKPVKCSQTASRSWAGIR